MIPKPTKRKFSVAELSRWFDVKPPRRSAPNRSKRPRKQRKILPRCKVCGHASGKHTEGVQGNLCACAGCTGYEPKRKPRSDKKPRGMRDSDLGRAKRTLWRRFSAYVKARDGNQCFTCDAYAQKGKLQAGHMFPGRTGALLFDPLVVFSQCAECNRGKRGNAVVFVDRYIKRFGIEQFQAAVARTSQERQWRTHEVRDLIEALKRGGADYECLYMERYGLAASTQERSA